jgi:hypothetical protein
VFWLARILGALKRDSWLIVKRSRRRHGITLWQSVANEDHDLCAGPGPVK